MKALTLNWSKWGGTSVPKECCGKPVGLADIVVTRVEVTLCQHDFKCHVQEHNFVYIHEVNINYDPNFMTCFYFFPCLLLVVKSNSSHCQLIDLFKSKESRKEKVDWDNNWKSEWFQSGIYFLRSSSGFVKECLIFVGNHPNF